MAAVDWIVGQGDVPRMAGRFGAYPKISVAYRSIDRYILETTIRR